ncbi:hypothetical protein AOC36_00065 [Erysipelothrix larvae]|uniref:Sortase n=1 Tax=Erysipelothrix larvae TaxID=1514105 RepID=A0A120JTC7_9FIRM|nr:sortase [Erysipelothrix larvae]AMC92441.1 hypothetical protein AOC36_00065 [Erysipelothrix larvae]
MKTVVKRKINWVGMIGFLLVIVGLSAMLYDFGVNYLEKRQIQQERQDFLSSVSSGVEEGSDFSSGQLADVYGILTIDKIGVDNPVVVNGDFDLLYRYLVGYANSALPPTQGNFTIVGHNGNCANCGFRNLDRLVEGDVITFTDKSNVTYTYEVYDSFTVDKSDIYVLDDIKNETTLTLITCLYPSLTDPNRLVIRARLVSE